MCRLARAGRDREHASACDAHMYRHVRDTRVTSRHARPSAFLFESKGLRYVTLHSACPAGPHTLTSYSCSISFHECESRALAPQPPQAQLHTSTDIHVRTVFRVRRGAYSRVQRAVHRDASPLHAARCARHAHAPLLSLSSRFSASTCYLEFELMPLAVAPIPLSERGRSGTRHTVAGPRNRRKRSGGRTAPRRATWG